MERGELERNFKDAEVFMKSQRVMIVKGMCVHKGLEKV
jgi:hypothetical protein